MISNIRSVEFRILVPSSGVKRMEFEPESTLFLNLLTRSSKLLDCSASSLSFLLASSRSDCGGSSTLNVWL